MTTANLPLSQPSLITARPQPEPGKSHVRRTSAWQLLRSVLGRVLHPAHLWRAISLQYHRKANRKLFADHRLEFYAKILPSDFLHYGFFETGENNEPESMSLASFAAAQTKYADLLIDLAGDSSAPVLDVGCGMGGLCRLLVDRGFNPTALTPDKLQAAYVAKMQPAIPVLRCKLEKMPSADHRHRYGTIFTAESLQYLKLDQALSILTDILKPGGRWVACDYFLTEQTADKTCHNWELFQEQLAKTGWKITHQRDITANVLPTLGFLHMLGTRFGLPLFNFITLRLRRKQPGAYHLLGKMFGIIEGVATDNVGLIDPTQFALNRRYLMLVIERENQSQL
jgi:cyclopropane fatty-acyl-phospholipid synthase-like methyltransferase